MELSANCARLLLFALAGLLVPAHCVAWGIINPDNTQIFGRGTANGTPLNVGDVLGAPVQYYVPATFNAVTVVMPATADDPEKVYTYDVAAMINDALALWSNPPRSFRPVTQPPGERFQGITYAYSSDQSDQSFGYTILDAPRSQARVSIVFPLIGLRARAMYNDLYNRRIIDTKIYYRFLDMLIWQTVLHETGHALGLVHPEDRQGHDAQGNNYIELVPRGSGDAAPSIMMGSATAYLEQLHARLQRPLVYDDIRPSPADLRAATYAWRGMSAGRLTRIVHTFFSCRPQTNCAHE